MTQNNTTTPQEPSYETQVGCNLRDFFFAANSHEIQHSYNQLRSLVKELPEAEDLDQLEFSFNRLFIGPKALVAPPYASVYLEKDELVMGTTTLDARDLYSSLGLSFPSQGTFPDDHISLEIDACLHLRQLQTQSQDQNITALYQQFLRDHLLVWAPKFATRIASAENGSETIQATADLLIDWLEQELSDHH
ncbi:chaperone TorD involved in molybdoenzyme TorA maturation [Desulfuromusa kysingii]|uniref:Chaperone TorD involved in molybdoenzyme TorA maturation n=1 Tax=Desulfuromusa kysingii TaxID=37625 RepID=A0A1H4DQS5_9BACT|nr:molecular chaperone TorD family protein [Desulfuromusa kysingii]SEA74916.1 chaperone TorD involved in molybdoenzyme TorA maturation [Desulfuromusa kysingii]